MNTPRISVVIPTYNRAQTACDCVRSVLASTYDNVEIIVVDDCSTDDTQAAMAREFGTKIIYLRNERNSRLGYSRNRGAQAASGKYLLFLDDDNRIEPDMITLLVADFERNPDDGVLAPMAIHHGGTKEGQIWTLGCDFNRWTSQPRNYCANIPRESRPTETERFPTIYSPNAFSVSKADYLKVGGFDESITFYFDESDFAWRVMETGKKNFILATAVTHHFNALAQDDQVALRELGINAPWRAYYLAHNRFKFAWRHFAWYQALSVTFVFAPLAAAYYVIVALRNRRPDIAWAYLKGTIRGMLGLK